MLLVAPWLDWYRVRPVSEDSLDEVMLAVELGNYDPAPWWDGILGWIALDAAITLLAVIGFVAVFWTRLARGMRVLGLVTVALVVARAVYLHEDGSSLTFAPFLALLAALSLCAAAWLEKRAARP